MRDNWRQTPPFCQCNCVTLRAFRHVSHPPVTSIWMCIELLSIDIGMSKSIIGFLCVNNEGTHVHHHLNHSDAFMCVHYFKSFACSLARSLAVCVVACSSGKCVNIVWFIIEPISREIVLALFFFFFFFRSTIWRKRQSCAHADGDWGLPCEDDNDDAEYLPSIFHVSRNWIRGADIFNTDNSLSPRR